MSSGSCCCCYSKRCIFFFAFLIITTSLLSRLSCMVDVSAFLEKLSEMYCFSKDYCYCSLFLFFLSRSMILSVSILKCQDQNEIIFIYCNCSFGYSDLRFISCGFRIIFFSLIASMQMFFTAIWNTDSIDSKSFCKICNSIWKLRKMLFGLLVMLKLSVKRLKRTKKCSWAFFRWCCNDIQIWLVK